MTEFGHEEPVFLSVAETARRLGVPERTLRRYLDRHGPYLPIRRNGRAVMVEASALPTLATIRDAYRRGLSAEQVEAELRDAGKPITIETVPAEALIPPDHSRDTLCISCCVVVVVVDKVNVAIAQWHNGAMAFQQGTDMPVFSLGEHSRHRQEFGTPKRYLLDQKAASE